MWAWLKELQDIFNERYALRSRCNSCEVLERELAAERREKDLLLARLLDPIIPQSPEVAPAPVTMPASRFKPWRLKQQELEREDAIQAARIRKEFEQRTASLEKELGVANAIRRSEEVPGGS